MTLSQLRAFTRWRRPTAKPIGPIHPTHPAPIVIACVLWAWFGSLWLPQSTPTDATAAPARIAGDLCRLSESMCAKNGGLAETYAAAPDRFGFICHDGAQFPPVRVRLALPSLEWRLAQASKDPQP